MPLWISGCRKYGVRLIWNEIISFGNNYGITLVDSFGQGPVKKEETMEKEKKTNYHEYEFGEQIDNLNACSTTDCTGLMWRTPKNEDEIESYEEIYDFEPPKVKN